MQYYQGENWNYFNKYVPQQKFTCSKLTIENLKKGVKYVQS